MGNTNGKEIEDFRNHFKYTDIKVALRICLTDEITYHIHAGPEDLCAIKIIKTMNGITNEEEPDHADAGEYIKNVTEIIDMFNLDVNTGYLTTMSGENVGKDGDLFEFREAFLAVASTIVDKCNLPPIPEEEF